MRTISADVAIIGGGPAGLLLSQLLMQQGIGTVVLERRSRTHVLSRIRAGVLEWNTVETLRRAGVGARMDAEGEVHHGVAFGVGNREFRIDFETVGRPVMVWGQTEVTRDLYAAQDALGARIVTEAEDVALSALDTERPVVSYRSGGETHRLEAAFVAGCDGFHGVSRRSIPAEVRREYERVYPFGWLGILSETPPCGPELIYANHPRGFALASMRNRHLSRYYIQVPSEARVEDWPDDAFWDELRRRLPADAAERLVTGPAIEKSITPLRSFVSEPMRWGRLFLAGDSTHIVPPTGAKGLNLAVADVHYLSSALIAFFHRRDGRLLDAYPATALARVWQAIRFSWWLTMLLHRFPGQTEFDQRMQEAELDHIATSTAAQAALAEVYTGRPY
jgi:p-hydroxybenzoate 3-monooxygenase